MKKKRLTRVLSDGKYVLSQQHLSQQMFPTHPHSVIKPLTTECDDNVLSYLESSHTLLKKKKKSHYGPLISVPHFSAVFTTVFLSHDCSVYLDMFLEMFLHFIPVVLLQREDK